MVRKLVGRRQCVLGSGSHLNGTILELWPWDNHCIPSPKSKKWAQQSARCPPPMRCGKICKWLSVPEAAAAERATATFPPNTQLSQPPSSGSHKGKSTPPCCQGGHRMLTVGKNDPFLSLTNSDDSLPHSGSSPIGTSETTTYVIIILSLGCYCK